MEAGETAVAATEPTTEETSEATTATA